MKSELKRILEASLGTMGLKRRLKEVTAVLAWPEVVGPNLARCTHARYLQGGILFVGTSGPAWSQQLSLMRPTLIAKLNAQLGEKIVTDIRFSVGLRAADEIAAAAAPQRYSLPDLPLAPELNAVAESLSDDLRPAFLRLARMQSRVARTRLAKAATVCRVCGQPTGSASDLCPVCRVTAAHNRSLKVRAALAQNLALAWTDAADLVPGLLAEEYHRAHDELMVQLWGALGRARDSAEPDALRRAAVAYLSCKYSRSEDVLPEEELAQLARVPVNRNRTNG